MKIVTIIPARYASTRFPGKLLAHKTGKYLIQHVYERVTQARLAGEIIVATDDKRISDACASFGANCCMTSVNHTCGTDRIAEVVTKMPQKPDIVINVQADEPEIEPANIDTLAKLLQDNPQADMATLAAEFGQNDDINNPNIVKVVMGKKNNALYFSRLAIPYVRDKGSAQPTYYKHIGLYAYRPQVLLELSMLKPTPLEQAEKLEQLRALENAFSIVLGIVQHDSVGIDTPEQYEMFVRKEKKHSAFL